MYKPGVKTSEFKVLVVLGTVLVAVLFVAIYERAWVLAGIASIAKVMLAIAYFFNRGFIKKWSAVGQLFFPTRQWLLQNCPSKEIVRKSTVGQPASAARSAVT